MVCRFVSGVPSGRTNNYPESGRGLGHVTLTILAVRSAILATAWLLVFAILQCSKYAYFNTENAEAGDSGFSSSFA